MILYVKISLYFGWTDQSTLSCTTFVTQLSLLAVYFVQTGISVLSNMYVRMVHPLVSQL